MTDDFTEFRKSGIGGSDASAVLNINPWRTGFDVYLEKIGETEPVPVSEPMLWGSLLESIVAAEYSRRSNRMVVVPSGPLRHPEYPWMIGHIDRLIFDQPDRIVEIKCSSNSRGWGEPGTDEVPAHYLCQCHHYLALTNAAICDLAVLFNGNNFAVYHVERDPQIEAELLDQEAAFWRLVENRTPPAPSNTADAVRRWGRLSRPGQVVANQQDISQIEKLRQIRNTRTELDAIEDEARCALMSRLGDDGDLLVDLAGTPLVSWRLDRGAKAYEVKAREPARRFLLK
jgi:putative phage-type endonuclease